MAETAWISWATTSATTTTANCDPFPTWCNNTSTVSTSTIWPGWCDGIASTMEERQLFIGRINERIDQLPAVDRQPHISQKKVAARKKAEALLKANLNKAQRKQFKKDKYFTVYGGKTKRRYHIREGTISNITECDENGILKRRLCAHPLDVPVHDTMLAQKLMLEHDEETFLRVANFS